MVAFVAQVRVLARGDALTSSQGDALPRARTRGFVEHARLLQREERNVEYAHVVILTKPMEINGDLLQYHLILNILLHLFYYDTFANVL